MLQLLKYRLREGRNLATEEGDRCVFDLHALISLALASDRKLRVLGLWQITIEFGAVQQDAVRSPDFETDCLFTVAEARDEHRGNILVQSNQKFGARIYDGRKQFRRRATDFVGSILVVRVAKEIVTSALSRCLKD